MSNVDSENNGAVEDPDRSDDVEKYGDVDLPLLVNYRYRNAGLVASAGRPRLSGTHFTFGRICRSYLIDSAPAALPAARILEVTVDLIRSATLSTG
jgi:hypothetical protein